MKALKPRILNPIVQIDNLYNIVYHTLQPGFDFRSSHPFWEIGYIDKGQLNVTVDDEAFLLTPGDFILYSPNVYRVEQNISNDVTNLLTITFEAKLAQDLNFHNTKLHLGYDEMRCIRTIIREATNTYAKFTTAKGINMDYAEFAPFGGEHIIKNRLEELFVYLYRFNNKPVEETKESASNSQKYIHNRDLVKRVQEYIDRNIAEKLTLEAIAKEHNVSVTHLKRLFKAQTGITIMTYLTETRLEAAKQLIRDGKYNFTQIAEKVGYDLFYFSEVFKKKTGMSPSEYAKNTQKKHRN